VLDILLWNGSNARGKKPDIGVELIEEHGALCDMTTITNLLGNTAQSGHLRPLDVRRDLGGVADLVEQCFADTLDSDGQRYIQQMRSLSRNPGTLNWIGSFSERTYLPLSGFVWEEDKRIVGNLTLIPYHLHQEQTLLIANVAVHPDYRRRGIANRLTARALEHARQRGIRTTWLHVREENEPAIKLYRSLGFQERARRTTWIWDPKAASTQDEPAKRLANTPPVVVGPRKTQDWKEQESWLRKLYPDEVTWHLSLKIAWLRPGLVGFLRRTFNDVNLQQWSARRENQLLGVMIWNSSHSYADSIWLAADADNEEEAATALLRYARKHLSPKRALSLDYPALHAQGAVKEAGFRVHQTLIWMSADTSQKS
jgi:ribosomal protein S18 acetylase RimI-like enzyme